MQSTHSPSDTQDVKGWAAILRRLSPSLVLAVFSVYVFSLPWLGLGIGYIILTQAIQMPALFRSAGNPRERSLHLARLAIWLIAMVAVIIVHAVREDAYRKRADIIVARLTTYSASNGRCAARIEDVGMSPSELKEELGFRAFYSCENGTPFLTYGGSFMIYSSWRYDFRQHVWDSHTSG